MTYAPLQRHAIRAVRTERQPEPRVRPRLPAAGGGPSVEVSVLPGSTVRDVPRQADDRHEREADRVAGQVVGGTTPEIREVQRSATDVPKPPVVHGTSVPLPPRPRAMMESRFGQDLASVRIHTGAAAEAACRSMRAHAYTLGENIYFGRGRYRPSTPVGDRLLAHELTHVLQQRGSGVRRVQREVDLAEMQGVTFKVRMRIGLFARPGLYEDPSGIASPAALGSIAKTWEEGINTNWSGPVPCVDGGSPCRLEMQAKLRFYPDARNRYQVPETNVVRVMPRGYRSNVLGWWGSWAHSEDGVTAAHEVGHMLGLADKYWQKRDTPSFKRFVGDLMANFHADPAVGAKDFGPARARLMRLHGADCPGCPGGLRRRPITGPVEE